MSRRFKRSMNLTTEPARRGSSWKKYVGPFPVAARLFPPAASATSSAFPTRCHIRGVDWSSPDRNGDPAGRAPPEPCQSGLGTSSVRPSATSSALAVPASSAAARRIYRRHSRRHRIPKTKPIINHDCFITTLSPFQNTIRNKHITTEYN